MIYKVSHIEVEVFTLDGFLTPTFQLAVMYEMDGETTLNEMMEHGSDIIWNEYKEQYDRDYFLHHHFGEVVYVHDKYELDYEKFKSKAEALQQYYVYQRESFLHNAREWEHFLEQSKHKE